MKSTNWMGLLLTALLMFALGCLGKKEDKTISGYSAASRAPSSGSRARPVSESTIDKMTQRQREKLDGKAAKADDLYQKGRTAFNGGDYEKAISLLASSQDMLKKANETYFSAQIIKLNNFLTYMNRQWAKDLISEGKALYDDEKYEAAVARFEVASVKDPRRHSEIQLLLSHTRQTMRKIQQ
jgi:tetratricopeptide (TPR) repeat protein